MKILIKAFSKAIFILALLLETGQVFAKKLVHHEIILSAIPEQVWALMSDVNRYAQWNPTLKLMGKLDKPLAKK